jgi:hypothetical protein
MCWFCTDDEILVDMAASISKKDSVLQLEDQE